MVEVGLAFVVALVAWSATAALTARYYRHPRLHMAAWVASGIGVAIALSAAFPGALLDFSGVTFRIFQIGVGLFGPLLVGWGAVEYVMRAPRARFGARLVATTLSIVPLVVLSLDRLRGRYDNGYPPAGDHYDVIPMTLLAIVHIAVVVALVACAVVAARRMGERPRLSRHELVVLGLLAAAALLLILVSRFGLGILGQLVMVGALACLWVAASRAADPPRERRSRRRGGRRAGGPDADQDEDDRAWDDDYDDRHDPEEDDVRRKRRKADSGRSDYDDYEDQDGYDDYGPGGGVSAKPSRLCGIITIYTLAEGHADAFDDCADEVVEEVSRHEPDTLLFACHTVPSAPSQRIVYAMYRDQLAYEEHQQQPHVIAFARRRAPHVVATNVIELSLSGASATENLAMMLMPR
ncbi:putative quinol monooxygenase [Marinactinospora rubrisoli]|uniref:Quinol monooxygenase n=1 Tax=Marinactinospora rubrisoli TaxID=2715399 RepID=A0ABW2K8V5_9ACTN